MGRRHLPMFDLSLGAASVPLLQSYEECLLGNWVGVPKTFSILNESLFVQEDKGYSTDLGRSCMCNEISFHTDIFCGKLCNHFC